MAHAATRLHARIAWSFVSRSAATCQAPVGGSCPTEVITLIGLSFITFPWWMPVAGLVMGGLAGWSLVAATQYLARRCQILLAGRAHDGSPGVSAVTPLVLDGGARAVLVERGWLYADDASTAHPERYPEPGPRAVIGIAEPLAGGRGGPPMRAVPSDSAKLWSMRWLDRDSLAPRLPYALAGFVVRQLPGEGIPGRPLRLPPRAYDETMHLSYAIQWFLFAAILLGGSTILAFTRRRDGAEIRPERSP